jgi:phosphoglycerate dehydrogenase-like enzyme
MTNVALLDDFQDVGRSLGPGQRLGDAVTVTAFTEAIVGLDALHERGVLVTGTGGGSGATLQLTWALLLAVSRHIVEEDAAVRAGRWQHTLGPELDGRTLGLFGLGRIGAAMVPVAMKPTAFLINTSRGPIVDTAALLDALHAGTIAGAGLDVYDQEPLPVDHPLRSAPRTVLTPHIGYVATGTYEIWWEQIVEDVEAFLAGSPIRLLSP